MTEKPLLAEEETYKSAQNASAKFEEEMNNFPGSSAGRGRTRSAIRAAAKIGDFRSMMGFSHETITSVEAVDLLRKVHPSRETGHRRKKGGKRK